MKRAGELLSAFFDEEILKKARGYHDLFSAWKSIAGDQIGAHSRIVELERSVLLVETDHPGWIQILQMKQRYLLNGVRRRFPELSISGISFRLSRDPRRDFETLDTRDEQIGAGIVDDSLPEVQPCADTPEPGDSPPEGQIAGQNLYKNISDPDFKETLMRLEQSIAARKTRKRDKGK